MEYITEEPVPKKCKKTKVLKEWEDGDIFKLISFVESEACIWNASVDGYHNKTMRDAAWRNIGEQFGATYSQSELTAKWTNLRIQFRSYAARAKSKSGQGVVETVKWKFFSAMSFVGRAEDRQTQETVSNLNFELNQESSSQDSSFVETIPLLSPQQCAAKAVRSKSDVKSASAQIAESMRQAVEAMRERNQNALEPNISFANYLVSELRTLPEAEAAIVRKRVTSFFLQCLEEVHK